MSDALRAATDRLAVVLEAENVALTALDTHAAGLLLPEKTQALAGLAGLANRFAAPEDPDLAEEARRLMDLIQENRALLERAIAAQTRVIGIVVRAAIAVAGDQCYGATGQLAGLAGPMALLSEA